ncbi:MAG TPA: RodZ domain-containing protein [Gammaproteobacteria bacterium]|nr:RodZ domain-containing protein [Gammaproteobacteria bacterium]
MSEDTREDRSETPRLETPESPGQRLQRARETAGLEVARVATELRLDARAIEALEQDRYDRLPPPIFVRGYLRAYGELLDLPVDELLEAHARLQPEEEKPLVAGEPVERGPGNGRMGLRVIVLVLLLLAVIGAVVWWFGSSPGHTMLAPAKSGGSASGAKHAGDSGTDPGAAKAAVARKMTVRHLAAPAPAADNTAGTPEAVPAAAAGPQHPVAGAEEQPGDAAPNAGQGAAQPATVPGGTRTRAAPQSGAAKSDGPPAAERGAMDSREAIPPSRRVQLALTFRQKSWVEVHDARRKRLLYTLVQAGQRRTLVAEAPVHVFLGNAPGVRVTVNGQRYPTDSHTRPNNTARFVLKTQ